MYENSTNVLTICFSWVRKCCQAYRGLSISTDLIYWIIDNYMEFFPQIDELEE